MKTEHLKELDVFRAVSALAVITIHVAAYFAKMTETGTVQNVVIFIDYLSDFAVASFVFISGLVLYKNYPTVSSVGPFYKKRFAKVLPIYLIFSIPLIVIQTIKFGLNPYLIIHNLLLGGAFYHLWYFGLLFQLYLLYPFLIVLYKKARWLLLLGSFVAQAVWNNLADNVISMNPGFQLHFDSEVFFLSHIFWFILGFYFIEQRKKFLEIKINAGLWFLIIAAILLLNFINVSPIMEGLQRFRFNQLPQHYFYRKNLLDSFMFLLEILLIYKVCWAVCNSGSVTVRCLKSIGFYSLEIYMFHALVLNLLASLLVKSGISYNDALFYPLAWIITLTVSYGLAVGYKKFSPFK